MTVSWDGSEVAQLAAGLRGSLGKLPDTLGAALMEAGGQVAEQARALAPRRTGRTARSIKADLVTGGFGADMAVEVGPTTRYARFQEDGTRKMAAHPFLAPALDSGADGMAESIADAAADALFA